MSLTRHRFVFRIVIAARAASAARAFSYAAAAATLIATAGATKARACRVRLIPFAGTSLRRVKSKQ